jgi:hypothetical protein
VSAPFRGEDCSVFVRFVRNFSRTRGVTYAWRRAERYPLGLRQVEVVRSDIVLGRNDGAVEDASPWW